MKQIKGITLRDNRWQVRTTYKGQKIYRQFSDGERATHTLARRYLQEEKKRIDMGQYYEEHKTLEEVYLFMDEERRDKGLKKEQSSKVTDINFENHIAVSLNKDGYIDSFTMDDIRNFQSDILKSTLSNRTKGNVIALLKQIFKTALRQGWIKTNYTAILDKPKVKKEEPMIYTEEEQKKLFAEAEKRFSINPNLLLFLALGTYGGLRRGESFGLQWRDIDFENHDIRIERQYNATLNRFTEPKTDDSKAVIPMCPELQDVLTRAYNRVKGLAGFKETDCVITRWKGGYTGKPLAVNGAYYLMSRLTRVCGISEKTRSHVLRKTCNTYMLNNYGLEASQAIMRHSKPEITWSVYTNKGLVNENTKRKMWGQKGA